jgi:hypothetical protein
MQGNGAGFGAAGTGGRTASRGRDSRVLVGCDRSWRHDRHSG